MKCQLKHLSLLFVPLTKIPWRSFLGKKRFLSAYNYKVTVQHQAALWLGVWQQLIMADTKEQAPGGPGRTASKPVSRT